MNGRFFSALPNDYRQRLALTPKKSKNTHIIYRKPTYIITFARFNIKSLCQKTRTNTNSMP